MSVTATHHALATEPQDGTRTIATLGQWDITTPAGEHLRIVATGTSLTSEQGRVSDVYEFERN